MKYFYFILRLKNPLVCLYCYIPDYSSESNKDKFQFSRISLISLQWDLPC